MRHLRHYLTIVLLLMALPINSSVARTAIHPQNSFSPMLSKILPAVVKITVQTIHPPSEPTQQHRKPSNSPAVALGSGVIIDAKKGLIITNAHVIDDAKFIVVTLSGGQRYLAKLVGKDDGFDLALLHIDAKHLSAIELANSNTLKVGDVVVAIGSPFGLSQTVTAGVVSALNRSQPPIEGYQNFIQMDTPINPGNSGGALVNTAGKLVGINTAIVSPTLGNIGIGFAIPSNLARSVTAQLLRYGKVSRGLLGVVTQNITADLADALKLKHQQGVIVTQVVAHTPASQAGLKTQDVILQVNDDRINNAAQLRNIMAVTHPNTTVTIKLLRQQKPLTLQVKIANPKLLLQTKHPISMLAGLRLQDFSDLEPDGSELKGVLVLDRTSTSPAALAGLIPGDIIVRANNRVIANLTQFVKIARSQKNQLLLTVARNNTHLFIVIQK